VDKLLATEESSVQDVDLRKILGRTQDGQWVAQEDPASPSRGEEGEEEEEEEEGTDSGADGPSMFESSQ